MPIIKALFYIGFVVAVVIVFLVHLLFRFHKPIFIHRSSSNFLVNIDFIFNSNISNKEVHDGGTWVLMLADVVGGDVGRSSGC